MKYRSKLLCLLTFILFLQPSRTYGQIGPKLKKYTISGTTKVGGVKLIGFPRVNQGGVWTELMSDETGKYQIDVLYGWSGTVTPVKDGFSFQPISRTYKLVKTDMTNENYLSTKLSEATNALNDFTVTVIPTKKSNPQTLIQISTDLNVILSNIQKAVSQIYDHSEGTDSNLVSTIMHGSATYIQDYGTLFTLRQRVPNSDSLTIGSRPKKKLILSLIHVASLHGVHDDKKIILTII